MNSSNYMYRQGSSPETRVAVSQKNRIYSKPEGQASGWDQIGAASSFELSESREIAEVRGVGMGDQIGELVPGNTEAMKITLNRMLMYTANIHQQVGYKGGGSGAVRSLKHHRWPFDIKQELVLSQIAAAETGPSVANFHTVNLAGGGQFTAMHTIYEACWMNSYSSGFSSDGAQVSEDTNITCTDVLDGFSSYGMFLESGNNPFVDGKQSSMRFGTATTLNPTGVV
jgi:hypothetical protein